MLFKSSQKNFKICSATLFSLGLLFAAPTHAQYNDISLQSKNSASTVANAASSGVSLSSSGQHVGLASTATNLVSSTTENTLNKVFRKDRSGTTVDLLSTNLSATQANAACVEPVLSADASYLAFTSTATNLVSQTDSNNASDVFIKNVAGGQVTRVSVTSAGVQANGASSSPAISSDGHYVAYASLATNLVTTSHNDTISDIFLHDRVGATTSQVTLLSGFTANGDSLQPAISADGRYVVFTSAATNLVSGSDNNGVTDIFRYDRIGDTIVRVSVSDTEVEANGASAAPSISDNGRYVVFESTATNLTSASDSNQMSDVFMRDITGGTTIQISRNASDVAANGRSVKPKVSGDGTKVVFLSDSTNLITSDHNNTAGDGRYDVFVKTVSSGAVERISRKFGNSEATGTASEVGINSDGTVFAFAGTGNYVSSNSTTTSTQHVYVVDQNCTADNDSDATVNCSDACPDDATKQANGGQCGCNVADTDTDSDGTADCVDDCPTDATKIARGSCGCGISETDSNGNGVLDCLEITANTSPAMPVLYYRGGNTIRAVLTTGVGNVVYRISLRRSGREVFARRTTSRNIKLRLASTGWYTVTYQATQLGITSKRSAAARFYYKRPGQCLIVSSGQIGQ